MKRSHKLSVCLVNLASLLTEFGPIRPIQSMKEIESRNVLSAEELKEKIFRRKQLLPAPESFYYQKQEEEEDEEEYYDEEEDGESEDEGASSPAYSEYSPVSPNRRR